MPRERVATSRDRLTTSFSIWLEQHMDKRNIPQLELAGKSKVSQGYINGILRQGRIPEDGKVIKLARALGADERSALIAVYHDRLSRVVESAPPELRARFEIIIQRMELERVKKRR